MSMTFEKRSTTSEGKSKRPTKKSLTFEYDFLLEGFGLEPTIIDDVLAEARNQKTAIDETIDNNEFGNIIVSDTINTE